tara:strand:+ start:2463 stop:2705 length:243 start_codon:yes stop_codon:yes gene_type:complete
MIYLIEATDETKKGSGCAGDTIESYTKTTKSLALKLASKLLKKSEVFSVWVHSYEDFDSDFITQWSKYKGQSVFRKTGNA